MNELEERLMARFDAMKDWLKDEYPSIAQEQKHLDKGTVEQGYWHFGYAMALKDVLSRMSKLQPNQPTA